ncbi:MAG TPA: hypothetical protein VMT49_05310 [Steroidobacteraceae bacterium]|nr:hypothetical protein [Steroidobacteraceae bacterium]
MNTRQLLEILIAAGERPRRNGMPHPLRQLPDPAAAAASLQLLPLQRRVVAARLGGGSKPVRVARTLYDDVQ